jgi:hypothetical protein
MNWLRSEGLKEEKVVTTPITTIRAKGASLIQIDLYSASKRRSMVVWPQDIQQSDRRERYSPK